MTAAGRRARAAAAAGLAMALAAVPATGSLAASADIPAIWSLHGQPGSYYGWAVSELADIDGDGRTDAIISAIYDGPALNGATYVVSGADGSPLIDIHGAPGELLGYGIADAGDVDGDGTADIVAGAPGSQSVRIVSGATGADLFVVHGQPGTGFGAAVAGAGDANLDGHADVLVGAPNTNGPAGAAAGAVHLVSGADGSILRTLVGHGPGERFGSATDQVADVDGDGRVDHVVGARNAGKFRDGSMFVYSGATGAEIRKVAAPKTGEDLGWFFVAGLPDMTGDGVPDLYAGDFTHSERGSQRGKVYLVSGASGVVARTWLGSSAKQGLGPGREAGDVDGDGVPDLVAGSYLSSDGGHQAGKAQVLSGSDGSVLRQWVGSIPYEQLGFDAVGLGDVDGRGAPDLLVSAANGSAVYLVAGEAGS